tara:strand:- start:1121 stop:1360 length:240 start_codon:yes stop_codon:yes gene_type:complete
MNTKEKGKLATGVVELQKWVKAQLQQRIEELTARAWDRDGDDKKTNPGKGQRCVRRARDRSGGERGATFGTTAPASERG